MCCSVLQRVAICRSMLHLEDMDLWINGSLDIRKVAVCCSLLQFVARGRMDLVVFGMLQCVAVCCSLL